MNRLGWTEKLIEDGLQDIEAKYGPNSLTPRPYHNADHAQDVMRAAVSIGDAAVDAAWIAPSDVWLLKLAACYHDIEQDLPEDNEATSAALLATRMRQTGVFIAHEVKFCETAILATRFHFVGPKIIQTVTSDYHTKILADADLSGLGEEFDTYDGRKQKIEAEAGKLLPPESQIAFLSAHRFHTPEAERLFPHKAANIARLKKLL